MFVGARQRERWTDFPRACDGGLDYRSRCKGGLDLNLADKFNGDSDQAIGFGL